MPNPGSEAVEIECEFRGRGKAAVLVKVENKEIWVPHVAIHEDNDFDWEDAARGDEGTLIIQRWLAEKEGLV